MTTHITNHWGTALTTRLELSEQTVGPAREGCSYHHHQHVLACEGTIYATFSAGTRNEDDVGQAVMLVTSDDLGLTWSAPRALASPPRGRFAPCVATACGLHAHRAPGSDAPRLVAYYGQYEYTAEGLDGTQRKPADAAHINTACYALYSDDNGETWSEPVLLLDDFVPNLGPQAAGSGRLVMPGSVVYPYTDDPTGLSGWTRAALPGLPTDHVDDSAGFQRCLRERKREHGYCEGSMFCTGDGVIHMMLRTNEGFLAVSESADNGESWSLPEPTDYTDNSSRHQFGRLPDGRFFGLSTPDPQKGSQRTPLVLALSQDGTVFDRHVIIGDAPTTPPRHAGLHKGGRYGYPYMTVCDGIVVVLYSVNKEETVAMRFPIGALD